MHPKNPHKGRYNFSELTKASPELSTHVIKNKRGEDSIDFDNPDSVKALNKAILLKFYFIKEWDIPASFLCPPIPGRADYIHTLSDLFPSNQNLRGLDIGVGANCIYPLIGERTYGWSFVGSDVDQIALDSAKKIIHANDLDHKIELRLQKDSKQIFKGIIQENENFDFSLCNPPFHSSALEAREGTERKRRNLKLSGDLKLNFGGVPRELWIDGGERAFISRMIDESREFSKSVTWFTTLVSKEANLLPLTKKIESYTKSLKVLEMELGQKKSRLLAWSFKV